MNNGQDDYPRDFKGIWIVRELWLRTDLGPTEKCLLAEIDSLDAGEGCWATDGHLAKMLHLSVSRLAHVLSSLRKRKLVKTIRTDGRKRYLRTCYYDKAALLIPTEQDGCKRQRSLQYRAKDRHHAANGAAPPSTAVERLIAFCAKQLEKLLRAKRELSKQQFRLSQWREQLRWLLRNLEGDSQRLLWGVRGYVEKSHPYKPAIESPTDFKRQFFRIERWLNRYEPPPPAETVHVREVE